MSLRRPATPTLDQLTIPERGELLAELLARHPELLPEAEKLARDRLATEDPVGLAAELEGALRGIDLDPLESRAARARP